MNNKLEFPPDENRSGPNLEILPLLLFVIFVFLRMAKVIEWPIVWVFSPIWIPIVGILVYGIYLVIVKRGK